MIINDNSTEIIMKILSKTALFSKETVFFAMETTGVSWNRSHLFLFSVIFFHKESWIHRQWFCQRPSEEKLVLKEFSDILQQNKQFVPLHGCSSAISYLKGRYQWYQMDSPFPALQEFDLYQKMQVTDPLKQNPYTHEEYISLYQKYLQSAEEDILRKLLSLTQEQTETMFYLFPELSIAQAGKNPSALTFVKADIENNVFSMRCTFSQEGTLSFTKEYPNFSYSFSGNTGIFHIPLLHGTLKMFFPNYKDYFYLPLEDEAIHKSVGIYVDKENRQKATAENCYKKITGRFLPQFDSFMTPVFKEDSSSKDHWFSLTPYLLTDQEWLEKYAKHLLSHINFEE